MNEEKILKAIGEIDNDLIKETEKIRKRKKSFSYSKLALIAACLALVTVSVILIYPYYHGKPTNNEETYSMEESTTATKNENTSPYSETLDNAEFSNENITEDVSVSVIPIYLSIDKIIEEGYICTVIDPRGNSFFSEGDTVTMIISDIGIDLSVGDKVYVNFSIYSTEEIVIKAHDITKEIRDDTPSLF